MSPHLQSLIDQLESQREGILEDIRGFTTEKLTRTPSPGKWSIAEILSHIITAERMSLLYMQKKIQGISETKDSGLMEEAKMVVLKISQRLPGLKFKAPKRVIENTAQYAELSTIIAAWTQVRQELRLLLDQIPDSLLRRLVYKHPLAGYLNVKQALQFFYEHVYHHTPQLKKLTKSK